jgi:hypothetical protein
MHALFLVEFAFPSLLSRRVLSTNLKCLTRLDAQQGSKSV